MILSIGILITCYRAISYTQCEICIGVEGTLLIPLAQGTHIWTIPLLHIGDVAQVAVSHLRNLTTHRHQNCCQLNHWVAIKCRRVEISRNNLGVVVEVINISRSTALCLDGSGQVGWNLIRWHTLEELAEHCVCNLAVDSYVVVLQECTLIHLYI